MKFLVALLVATSLVGCSSPTIRSDNGYKPLISGAQEMHDLFVGKWHGKAKIATGGDREWLTERKPDGTFTIYGKATINGITESQSEYGVWGVAGGTYFTITQGFFSESGEIEPADTSDANLYDAYDILEATNTNIRYKGKETGNVFTVTRVSRDFSLYE